MDNFLLQLATKFSHRLQSATGLTCFKVAKFGLFIATVTVVVHYVNRITHFVPELILSWVDVFCGPLILVGCVLNAVGCDRAHNSLYNSTTIDKRLIMKRGKTFRLFCIVLSFVDFVSFLVLVRTTPHPPVLVWILECGMSWGVTIFLYFSVVTPLPPGRSKVREFIKKLSHTLIPVRNTT